ncbi:hypothetical protein M569_12800, partial [Genlisea aurea]
MQHGNAERISQLECDLESRFQWIESRLEAWREPPQAPAAHPPQPASHPMGEGVHVHACAIDPAAALHSTARGGGVHGEGGARFARLSPAAPEVPQFVPQGGGKGGFFVRPGSDVFDTEGSGVASEMGEFDRSTGVGIRAIGVIPSMLKPVLTEMLKSQPKKIFSGHPEDFPAWKRGWEAFIETLKASAGGAIIPDKAMLRILEGWLDDASQKILQAKLEMNPEVSYQEFMTQLCTEFDFVRHRGDRNRWRTIKLQWEGENLQVAEWRRFKATLQESLVGVEEPPEKEMREYLLQQLPRKTREAVVKKEIERSTHQQWVSVYFPPNVNRGSAVETLGEELGLRIRDNTQGNEPLVVNCLNESLVEKALSLDGAIFNNPGGHPGGKISVQRVKSMPLGVKELMAMVDALVWGEYEVQRMAPAVQEEKPKENHPPWKFQREKTPVRVVANNSPNRGRPSSPRDFPSGGKGGKGGKGGDSRAPSPSQKRPQTPMKQRPAAISRDPSPQPQGKSPPQEAPEPKGPAQSSKAKPAAHQKPNRDCGIMHQDRLNPQPPNRSSGTISPNCRRDPSYNLYSVLGAHAKKSAKSPRVKPQITPNPKGNAIQPEGNVNLPRYKREDYTIRQDRLREAIQALEVETPRVDAFASPENSRCPLHWDLLSQVVEKLEEDQATALLLCPEWKTAPWWEKAQKMAGVASLRMTRGDWDLPDGEYGLLADEKLVVPDCTALIDTGAEICVLKKGLVPPEILSPAKKPLRLVGANERRLEGGDKEVTLLMCLWATNQATQKKIQLRIPTTFYVADIKDPLILSYAWCQGRGVDILPRKHGLVCKRKGEEFWVEGLRSTKVADSTSVNAVKAEGKNKLALDLFSGTGSTSLVLQKAGFTVTSVDVDPRAEATFCADILEWDYKQFPPGHFALIAASPPCTEFSRAKTVGTRNLELAGSLVLKTLEIIQYFQPPRWWLETP